MDCDDVRQTTELDVDSMKQEVKKKMPKGISFIHKEIGELKKYFNEYKTEFVNIKSKIDRMVYELYGLPDEEIGIVEGSV